ncbi:MAG: hypothetical protein J5693_00210 [Bacteroidales bacterium]|nr:hypothetical protein [Bacteroidales bacterium]
MTRLASYIGSLLLLLLIAACSQLEDPGVNLEPAGKKDKMNFDIMVTRDGQVISKERTGIMTKGTTSVEMDDKYATMDEDTPFGLIAIDFEHNRLLVDNSMVEGGMGGYSASFYGSLWSGANTVNLSAYYPYVNNVEYGAGYDTYAIPYSVRETEAGPLVSKTVERAIEDLNMIPLVFQHITNDIGYKICDITPDEDLQGLIHLRKVTAANVASAGVFENDVRSGAGFWRKQGYYRKVVVFDGDAKVGVGSQNEMFIGYDTLEEHLADSHRYYSIPDEIELGKQYVEVVFDVEGFTHNNFYYEPLFDQVRKYMLYGLLPDNVFEYGKQYTFHIGLDLSSIYREITFAPAVADWETTIYENNEDF